MQKMKKQYFLDVEYHISFGENLIVNHLKLVIKYICEKVTISNARSFYTKGGYYV